MSGDGIYLNIKPAAPEAEQRRAAVAIAAAAHDVGVRMEVWSGHTEFYADDRVPVGKVWIWAVPTYKGQLVEVTTLDDPDDEWNVSEWLTRWRESEGEAV